MDKQKANADIRGRKNMCIFSKGDRVLLSTEDLQDSAVTNLGASKLAPRFIGSFTGLKAIGDAYTLDIPTSLRLHPKYYVGWPKQYRPSTLHAFTLMMGFKVRKPIVPRVLLDAPMRLNAAAFPFVHFDKSCVPDSSSI